ADRPWRPRPSSWQQDRYRLYKEPWPRRASADPCRRAIVGPRGVREVGRWAGRPAPARRVRRPWLAWVDRPAPARRVRRPWLAWPDRPGPVGSWVDRPAPARRVRRPWLARPDRPGPVGSWVDRPAPARRVRRPVQVAQAWAGCREQEQQAYQGSAIQPRRVPPAHRPGQAVQAWAGCREQERQAY